ncbi:MAG: hypothetical protein WDW38_002290 [Sanguina aurantia]
MFGTWLLISGPRVGPAPACDNPPALTLATLRPSITSAPHPAYPTPAQLTRDDADLAQAGPALPPWIHLSPLGSGLSTEDSFELYCGDGHQVLQWVGYAACSRLAYKRGELYGRYVPQSVSNKDGQAMDIDIVLNEMFNDGDELLVEFSGGPQPFRVSNLTKGALQMIFLVQSAEGATSGEQLGQMTLPQFRGIMSLSKAITPRFPPEKVDEIFTNVATSEQTLARKVENKSGVSTFDLHDFMAGLVHTAHHRYAAENPLQSGYMMLSFKLASLLNECLSAHAFPDVSRKLERLQPATHSSPAALLMKRGRKLVELTLDSCQLKRCKASVVRVDLRWLCTHLLRWGMLGRDFNLQELCVIGLFAKQKGTDFETFVLHSQPIDYNYDEFEKLLLGIASHMHTAKKRTEPFEEYLGGMMDMVFKKAGVLAEVANLGDQDD